MKKVCLISLGCHKNLVDSEVALGVLEEAGYSITKDPSDADVIIVNTCAFIEDAKRESIDAILAAASYKEACRGKKRLVVTGCLTQRYKEEVARLFPEVDLFLGVDEYDKIASLVESKQGLFVSKAPRYIYDANTPRKVSTPPHSVYLKIAEGCMHHCSFCVIPKIRGRYRSRSVDDITTEAQRLLAGGAKELNLIAQDTTSYGRDLCGASNISTLLRRLSSLGGEKWIRLMYAYPSSIRRELISTMKECPCICRYLDIPIQHIDDHVLRRMGRRETSSEIRRLISWIKDEIPDISLRTSIIVGFPGETERQFERLVRFIEEGYFDHVGVFTYSKEEGTAAARLGGEISRRVKLERQKIVLEAQRKVSKRRLRSFEGKRLKVLIDGHLDTPYLIVGRTEFQAPEVDGVVYIEGKGGDVGKFYLVEVKRAYEYDLVGRIV